MDQKRERIKRIARIAYLAVPLVSATISAFHVESLLRLGNPTFLSVSTAIAYEVANIGAMIIFVLVPRVKMNLIWTAFFILVFMQILGNVYFSYDWIQDKISSDPEHVTNFVKMIRALTDYMELETIVFMLAALIGAPVPIVALLLTKGTSDYLSDEKDKEDKEASPLNSEVIQNTNIAEAVTEEKENISPVSEDTPKETPNIGEDKKPDEPNNGSGIIVNY